MGTLKYSILLSCVLVLAGCSRYTCLFRGSFTGGQETFSTSAPACPFMCSLAIYDQLQTIGLFDVLWLSCSVRSLFVDLYAQKNCLSCHAKQQLLSKELAELQKTVSFYVLMPTDDTAALGDSCNSLAPWSIYAVIDGQCYRPSSIKKVKLPPEYSYMLAERYSSYRQPYLVTFNRADDSSMTQVELVISSVKYKTSCSWYKRVTGWQLECEALP